MSRRLVAPLVGIVAFLAMWEAVVRLGDVRPFVLRAPSRIVAYLADHFGDYASAAWVTAQHALIGSAIGLLVALIFGSVARAFGIAVIQQQHELLPTVARHQFA